MVTEVNAAHGGGPMPNYTMRSWCVAEDGDSASDGFRHRAYHKTGYQPVRGSYPLALREGHRIVHHFHNSGVERDRGDRKFAYGSDAIYASREKPAASGRRNGLEDRTSAERIKLKRQQQETEAAILAREEARLVELHEKAAEKRKDLAMLRSYQPWGKPAGGAPRVTASGKLSTRRQRLDSSFGSSQEEYHPFGRPGAGAPLRSNSGKLVTSLRGDPDTRFQSQLKKEVINSLRYRNSGEKQEKDTRRQIADVPRTESEKMREDQEKEQQMNYIKKLDQQRWEEIERKEKERTNQKVGKITMYNPWGKSGPVRDRSGKLFPRRWVVGREIMDGHVTDEDAFAEKYGGMALGMRRRDGESPLKNESVRAEPHVGTSWEERDVGSEAVRRRRRRREYYEDLQRMVDDQREQRMRLREEDSEKERQHMDAFHRQWGRPGAGAPRFNEQGQVDTSPKNNSLLEVHAYNFRRSE